MVNFCTDLRTARQIHELMQRWMNDFGQGIESELSNDLWVQRLGDFARSLDLDALAAQCEPDQILVCELGGRGPTAQALVYRFICWRQDRPEAIPAILDIEESICDRICLQGLWEVVPAPLPVRPKRLLPGTALSQ
ncbi:MAG: hypothetical protein OSB70_04660 [Myxococcota bacterium]|nr:hypothetical protein [Myxococcota bacterium]